MSHGDAGGVRLQRDSSLTDRAARMLASEPLATAEVAERVMGLRGGARAVSAAVFALLGDDPRFAVSPQGVWSVTGPTATGAARRALADEEWVVVDVETTGGAPSRGHRVTEVAAVRVRGGRLCEVYSTLVNPERTIPGTITSLTGISEGMVEEQPRFGEVAEAFSGAMEGAVFVAHNAAFDWRFVCHELRLATGMTLSGRSLCTHQLSRRLLPQLTSRSLDGLALYFGVEIEARHRAQDDAVATARVLLRMLDMLEEQEVRDWAGLQELLSRRKPRQRKRRASPGSMEAA